MSENTEKIIHVDIKDEMKKSYIDYAMSVIVSRALPDVRDGLKPVHRRILYAMSELGLSPDKPHRKSARIVGDVLGKYHPHGDSSVYNAMVRLAQPFATRNLLVDGHGNFGSIDGDGAAAMRYTEARMTKIAVELLKDIEKETVNYNLNFDETLKEPAVLPCRFPNLLCNGSSGIAVGMATSIPPHNLGEIIDATVAMIDNPEIDIEDIIDIVKGPDFPTGAEIMGMEGFKKAYRTGNGRVVVRSKTDIEEKANGKSSIIVTEIPYQVNKSKLLEGIADLARNKKIDGITDLRDESDRNGIRVVIELRRDVNPNVILNQLYKHSQLQNTFSINMIALVEGQPKILNLRQIIKYYIEHQREVETRRVNFDLKKAMDRAHILEGLLKALDNIDRIIKIIRASENGNIAKGNLIAEFEFTDVQAQAILDMRLQRLTGLERDKIETEYGELEIKIEYLQSLLNDMSKLMEVIKEDLITIREKYSDDRRTEISFSIDDINIEDMIDREDVTITLTHKGYIKRVPVDTYSIQKRGGKGKLGLSTREEDFVENIFTTSTHNYILFFTNKGKMYKLKAYQIPEASRQAKGTAIINLLQLDSGEEINAVIPIDEFNEDQFLIFVTKNGIIKKTSMKEFDTNRKTGLIALNLRENDELIGVKASMGIDDILIVTNQGKSIRFNNTQVRSMGRTATGVTAIKLVNGDYVVGIDIVSDNKMLLVVSENGYGKRTELGENIYRPQMRGGKGILTYKITEKTGKLIGAKIVEEDDDIILINKEGTIIRISVNEISSMGRVTSGVTLMRVDGEENQVVSIAKVNISEESDEEVVEESEE